MEISVVKNKKKPPAKGVFNGYNDDMHQHGDPDL